MKRNETLAVTVLKDGNTINVKSTGTDKSWSLVLKDVTNVADVNGLTFEVVGNDTKITIPSGTCEVACKLK